MSLAKRLYLSISRLREPRALRMVVGITIALSLLMGCATQKAVSGDVTAKFISLRSERTDSLTKKREEWKQANEAFNKRFESDRKKTGSDARVGNLGNRSGTKPERAETTDHC